MKVTNFGPPVPLALGGWSTGVTSLSSNAIVYPGGPVALNFVQLITANGSNRMQDPIVDFSEGSNITFSLTSNSIRVHSTGGSAGNIITSNGSNALAAVVNLKAGTNVALGVSGQDITISAAGSGGSSGGTDPWYMEGSLLFPTGNTNWTTINLDAGEINAHDMESSGAQNDEIYWDLGISGGTWDFQLLHFKGSNRGIYTVSIDGSSIGTIDGYNAGVVKNVRDTITGVSITGGKRRLKLKMATKNASSPNYFGTATTWFLRRTA